MLSYLTVADPGIQTGEGSNLPKKKKTSEKKGGGGEGGRLSIYSALVWSKSNSAKETVFRTITFFRHMGGGGRRCFLPIKTSLTLIVLAL